jgi:hypothetical protein
MFEDIDGQKGAIEITRDAADRSIVYAIWARTSPSGLSADAAWAILHERYPNEPRFLLFSTYEQLRQREADWTATAFLERVQRILDTAGGKLNPEVRDLLAMAEDDLHGLSESDGARLDRIRGRVGARTGDGTAAAKRLSRLAADVVRELHEKTTNGRRIGGSGAAAAGATDWKSAIAAAGTAKKPYSATAKVAIGDVVEHPKFGPGVVTAVEAGRATILFESGTRKLVSG